MRQFRVTLDHPDTGDARAVVVQARTAVQSQDAATRLMQAGERVIAINEIRGAAPAEGDDLPFPGTQTHPEDRGA